MNKQKRLAEILVVDDDHVALHLATSIFARSNITNELHLCSSGEGALDFLYKRNGYEDVPTPDVIYLDLILPGISGTEVLETITTDVNLKHIPVIMLTNSDASVNIEFSSKLGASGYISKPLTTLNIMETILHNDVIKVDFMVDCD